MMCAREGCQKFATKRPVWSFAAKVQPKGARMEVSFDLGACDEHATADAFLPNEESWAYIEQGLRTTGHAMPDRATFRLTYAPFEALDPVARSLLGASPTVH